MRYTKANIETTEIRNAHGYKQEVKVLSSYISEDGVTLIQYKQDIFKNGYSMFDGKTEKTVWEATKDGKAATADTRAKAHKNLNKLIVI